MPTEYDPQQLARLLGEGKSLHEIADLVDGERGPTPAEQAAAQGRRDLQTARSALNAESAPPGQEPQADPYESAFAAARRSGGPRGSDRYMEAGLSKLFEAAAAGDPRVASEGVPRRETLECWHQDGIERQIANNQRQEWSGRQR